MGYWSVPPEVHGNGRFLMRRRGFVPAYLRTYEEGRLQDKVEEALAHLGPSCQVCPRLCKGVDRRANQFGVCRVGRHARVASAFPHFGEEDVLRGWRGSGTIFFSWCNLRCVFCLPPDGQILTERGFQRIEDLFLSSPGEIEWNGGKIRFPQGLRVYTRQGQLASAVKAFAHPHRGELIQIKPYGLPLLVVTPNHSVFAALRHDLEARKVPAEALTKDHLLVVPKLRPVESPVELDCRELLQPWVSVFRKSVPRRVPAAKVLEMAETGVGLPAGSPTSRQIGEQLGYHPSYVRTLLSRLRRGQVSPGVEEEHVRNDLVEEKGRIRFKTEKGPGLPACLRLDAALACLLGYYCAEGHIRTDPERPNSHRLVFSYGRHEASLAERTRELLRQVFGVEASLRLRRTTLTVELGNTSLALLFRSLCGGNSGEKHIPPMLPVAPTDSVWAFLRSYGEGDGCRQPSYFSANTVSRDLALGLTSLLLRVGIFPYFYPTRRPARKIIEGRYVKQSEVLYYVKCRWEVWEGGSPKQVCYRETPEAFLVPIRRLSRIQYEGTVYNLEVADGDHSFIASGLAVGNCQNFETSQVGEGEELDARALADVMLHLQKIGCHNINFVTPEHVVPQIVEALPLAIAKGLRLPLVYNTSSYDSAESLRVMDGLVDVYMPDFKLWDEDKSRQYLSAVNYPQVARAVIAEMHRQVGDLKADEDGLALRGVLIRHLVMPGRLEDTRRIVGWLAGLSRDSYLNLMDQYYPAWKAQTNPRFAEINRRVKRQEMVQAFEMARAAGLWRLDDRWRQVAAWSALSV
jgi:putative pyruvate formate lyase activating enzyme